MRRLFLLLVSLSMTSAGMAGDRHEAAARAVEVLKERGYTVMDYSALGEGRGLRGKMLQPPNGWHIVMMDRTMTMTGIPRADYFRVIVPLPADIGDQAHLATTVEVAGTAVTGKNHVPLPKEKYEVDFSDSTPGKFNPYKNPFLVVALKRPALVSVEIRIKDYVMMPLPNPVGAEALVRKGSIDKGAVEKYMGAQECGPFKHWQAGRSVSKQLSDYLVKERKFKHPMEFVDNALVAAKAVAFRADLGEQNPSTVMQRGGGDSGGKASVAKRLGGGYLEYLEGYCDDLKAHGGRHAWMLGMADGGMYHADCLNNGHIGEQRSTFIVTTVGGWNVIPYVNNVGEKAVVSGWVIPPCKKVEPLSVVSITPNPVPVPNDVLAYFQARKNLREEVYGSK